MNKLSQYKQLLLIIFTVLIIGAGKASFGEKFEYVEDINFENALFLPDSGEPPYIQIDISHDGGDYFLYTMPKTQVCRSRRPRKHLSTFQEAQMRRQELLCSFLPFSCFSIKREVGLVSKA